MMLNRSIIARLFAAICLLLVTACPGWADEYGYIGKYNNASGTVRCIIGVNDKTIYTADGFAGVECLNISNLSNITRTYNIDTADTGYETYAVALSDDYVFSVQRSSGGSNSDNPDFLGNFDKNNVLSFPESTDLVNGTDLSSGTSQWTGGYKSAAGITISSTTPFWGNHAASIDWSAAGKGAYTEKSISSTTGDYYIQFWLNLKNVTWSSGSTARIYVFGIDGVGDQLYINLTYKTANTFTTSMVFRDDSGSGVTITSSNELNTSQWYEFKAFFKSDASSGGAQYWYRSNCGDSFASLGSDFTKETSAKNPDKIRLGILWTSAGCTAGKLHFDEVAFDDVDLSTTYEDEGYICSMPANLSSEIDRIWFDAKCSDAKIKGNYLYISSQTRGLIIVDISDPSNLQYAGAYNAGPFETQGLCVGDGYAYLANYTYGLSIVDISDNNNPTEISRIDFASAKPKLWDLEKNGKYIFGSVMCASADIGSDDDRGIVVIDVYDPSNPLFATVSQSFGELPEHVKSAAVSGSDTAPLDISYARDRIYIANGLSGVSIYDVTNPENPRYIETIDSTDDVNICAVLARENFIIFGDGPYSGSGTDDIYAFIYTISDMIRSTIRKIINPLIREVIQ